MATCFIERKLCVAASAASQDTISALARESESLKSSVAPHVLERLP